MIAGIVRQCEMSKACTDIQCNCLHAKFALQLQSVIEVIYFNSLIIHQLVSLETVISENTLIC